MIYKAIVDQVLNNGYNAKIRIPKLHKIENASGATPSRDLPIASICMLPGILPAYKKGDIVFVAFENDATDYPLILGQLYCDLNNSQSNIKALSISAESHANLPVSTNIGDIQYNDIQQLKEIKGSAQNQINILEENKNYLLNQIKELDEKIENLLQQGV